jgi:hypothetical protein
MMGFTVYKLLEIDMSALSLLLENTGKKKIVFGFFLIVTFLVCAPPAYAQFRERFFQPDHHMIPMPPQHIPHGYASPQDYGSRRYAPQPRVVFLRPDAIKHRLALQGFNVSRIWRRGDIYLAEGVDRRRVRVRVAAEPYEGSVLEVIALGAAQPAVQKHSANTVRKLVKPPVAKQKTARLQKIEEEDDDEVVVAPRIPRSVKTPMTRKPEPEPQRLRSKITRIEKNHSAKKDVVKSEVEKKSTVAKVNPEVQAPSRNNLFSTPKNTDLAPPVVRNPVVKKISKLPSGAPLANDLELSAPQPAISPVEEVKPAPKTPTKQGRG